jgi:hypothetical protein
MGNFGMVGYLSDPAASKMTIAAERFLGPTKPIGQNNKPNQTKPNQTKPSQTKPNQHNETIRQHN